MKITRITANNRKKEFEIHTRKGIFTYPYSQLALRPTASNPIRDVHVDPELGREGFTYTLASGKEDSIHIDRVLEYHQEADTMANLLLYRLTTEANRQLEKHPMAIRSLARRLHTSTAQLYRLLDPTNYRKSVNRMLDLLHHLGCEVELVIRPRKAG